MYAQGGSFSSASAELIAGAGGNAWGTGNAADGGAASATDAVVADAAATTAYLYFNQQVTGGAGGLSVSGLAGHGGAAFSGQTVVSVPVSGALNVTSSATGGSGGGTDSGVAGIGGAAMATALGDNTGGADAYVDANAHGGGGGAHWTNPALVGAAGNALASATSLAGNHAGSTAFAQGGAGGHTSVSGTPGTGADAHAISTSDGVNSAVSTATANGGGGGFNYATGETGMLGLAWAQSAAVGGTYAYSTANSTGLTALSQADARSLSGNAGANSNAAGLTEYRGTTAAGASVGSTANVETWMSAEGTIRSLGYAAGKEAYLYGTTNASDANMSGFLAGNATVETTFMSNAGLGTVGAEMIGLGSLGGQFSDDGTAGVLHSGALTASLQWTGSDLSDDGKTLYLGLFNGQMSDIDDWSLSVISVDSGFSQTWTQFTGSFSDLFDDNALNLGTYAYNGFEHVDIYLNWSTDKVGGYFNGDFAVGFSTVPEPATIVLWCVAGLAGVGIVRRQRRKTA